MACRLLTQTAIWRPNHVILISSVKAILKAIIDMVVLGQTLRVVRILYFCWEVLSTRESTLVVTGWTLSYEYFLLFFFYKNWHDIKWRSPLFYSNINGTIHVMIHRDNPIFIKLSPLHTKSPDPDTIISYIVPDGNLDLVSTDPWVWLISRLFCGPSNPYKWVYNKLLLFSTFMCTSYSDWGIQYLVFGMPYSVFFIVRN